MEVRCEPFSNGLHKQNPRFLSLLNLAAISLERVHATFCPLKHRLIDLWVYGVIITVTWLTTIAAVLTGQLSLVNDKVRRAVYFSAFLLLLFIISVSYISIFIKIHFSRRPQHHSAAGVRGKKLTSTLLIVTLGSFLTWFPSVILLCFSISHPQFYFNLPFCSFFHISMITVVLYLANSMINPIIYALRMPEFRKGIKQILFHETSNRLN